MNSNYILDFNSLTIEIASLIVHFFVNFVEFLKINEWLHFQHFLDFIILLV